MPKSKALSDNQMGMASGGAKERIYAKGDDKHEKPPLASLIRSTNSGRPDILFTDAGMQKRFEKPYCKEMGLSMDEYKKKEEDNKNVIT